MPTAFKVVRDSAISWQVPGGGVTWGGNVYADSSTVTVDDDNGVIPFTVGKTGTYCVSTGRNESIGTAPGGLFVLVAGPSTETASLTEGTQYYAQGPLDAARSILLMLGYKLSVKSDNSLDSATVSLRGLNAAGVDMREELVLSGASTVNSANYYSKVVSITKQPTSGQITVSDSFGHRFKMGPKQTDSRFTRIEFDTVPTDAGIMSVVYKKRVRELEADGDSPQINSIENALMTMALGDLYTKTRQLAKASLKYQEGVAMLEVVRERESVQQAQSIVLVPQHLGGYQCNDFGWV